jgi:hypothetical protein
MADIEQVDDGIEYSDYKDHIIIRIRKDKTYGESKSGKTVFNANSHGWKKLPNGMSVNIMAGTPKSNKKTAKTPAKRLNM